MSVREEDRRKNNCSSRGLGLAAAAIGVGVGAALYYFFSKRPENPDVAGSTSNWTGEQPHALNSLHDDEDSYITVSEYSTTDTSMYTSDRSESTLDVSEEESSGEDVTDLHESESYSDSSSTSQYPEEESSGEDVTDLHESESYSDSSSTSQYYYGAVEISENQSDTAEIDFEDAENDFEDSINSEFVQWDTSLGIPEWDSASNAQFPRSEWSRGRHLQQHLRQMLQLSNGAEHIDALFDVRQLPNRDSVFPTYIRCERPRTILTALTEEEQIKILKDQAFRERSWSLEDCSICFDVILKDQQVTTLPCTHHFHSACITPWLQEQQTCPNCRELAE